jgi:hypothetical protein
MKLGRGFILFIAISITGCGSLKESQSLKLYDNMPVPDGEYLRYGKYQGGEKIVTIYFVTRFENANNKAEAYCYMDAIKAGSGEILPEDYKDYPSKRSVSLETGSLQELTYNWPVDLTKKMNDPSKFPGEYYRHYLLNGDVMNMESRTFSGYRTNYIKNRVSIKKGYPVWDLDTAMIFSFRYFNIFKPGIIYIVVPSIIKDPLPAGFKVFGKEKLKTGIGEINTVKIGLSITDPFLGRLLSGFLDTTFLWVEDSGRKLLVRVKGAGLTMELEAVSNVLGNQQRSQL